MTPARPAKHYGGGSDDNSLSNFVGLQRVQIGAIQTARCCALGADLRLRERHVGAGLIWTEESRRRYGSATGSPMWDVRRQGME